MATGIIATLNGNTSVTFTPQNDAKIKLSCAGASTNVTVNSSVVFTGSATITNAIVEFYAAAGIAVTIATGASVTCLASALES